jgi:hypothetical protein
MTPRQIVSFRSCIGHLRRDETRRRKWSRATKSVAVFHPGEETPMKRSTMVVLAALLAGDARANPAWPGFFYPGNQAPAYNQISYGGGGVMTGTVDVYLLFYGSWTDSTYTYQYPPPPNSGSPYSPSVDWPIIQDYVNNLGSSQHFKIVTTYYDEWNHHPTGLNLAMAWLVPLGNPYGSTLNDANSLQQLIHDQIKANLGNIANPDNSVFIVLPTPNITVLGSDGKPMHGGFHQQMSSGFWQDLNSSFTRAPKFAVVSPSAGFNSDGGFGHVPNSPLADTQVNYLTHELFETITDPYPNSGWNSASLAANNKGLGGEVGDLCEEYGIGLRSPLYDKEPHYTTANGGIATIRVGSRDYRVQREWINRDGGYCGFFVQVPGDFNTDGKADLVNVDGYGAAGDTVEYLAHSTRGKPFDGTFVNSTISSNFNPYTSQYGVHNFTGSFGNTTAYGDAYAGLLAVGGPSWNTVPIDSEVHIGTSSLWHIANDPSDFNSWAQNNKVVVGSFFGDGLTGLAALSNTSGGTIAVLRNQGNGFLSPTWGAGTTTTTQNVMGQLGYAPFIVTGDFNGDGYDDIAGTGVNWWQTMPVAFSNGDSTFTFVNDGTTGYNFNTFSSAPGAKVVAGDFNGDGLTDLLATGASGWNGMVIVALSQGNGVFNVQEWSSDFNLYSVQPGVHVIAGDFDGDGKDDLTAVGGANWNTIPVALSRAGVLFSYFASASNVQNSLGVRAANGTSQTLSSWFSGPFQ